MKQEQPHSYCIKLKGTEAIKRLTQFFQIPLLAHYNPSHQHLGGSSCIFLLQQASHTTNNNVQQSTLWYKTHKRMKRMRDDLTSYKLTLPITTGSPH